MDTLFGQKKEQAQTFLENGKRIPVTRVGIVGNVIISFKANGKMQIGFGTRKKANKPLLGILKGANIDTAPRFLREVSYLDADKLKLGDSLKTTDVFHVGDLVNVRGTSKGKGFAGVVKRHHFRGGPRTHGQSDRERAPGSIGQTTTPGRVYKGKRMAGNMGMDTVTVRNLEIVGASDSEILIKGLLPGLRNSYVEIKKVGQKKKSIALFAQKKELKEVEKETDTKTVSEKEESTTKREEKEKEDAK